jgi:hypothetical protein
MASHGSSFSIGLSQRPELGGVVCCKNRVLKNQAYFDFLITEETSVYGNL